MSRKSNIDFLKVIGLLLLILAHVSAPAVLEEIREFDVPLMVFLSGMLAVGSYNHCQNSLEYFKKRFTRLVLPTWIFLILFWACMAIVGQTMDLPTIIKSFLFQRDSGLAGYVWIIWIYLWTALVVPFLLKIHISSNKGLLLYLIVWAVYDILAMFEPLTSSRVLYYTLFSIVPYGLVTLIGINYKDFNKKNKLTICVTGILIFIIGQIASLCMNNSALLLSDYKYPLRLMFCAYSIPICIVLYELSEKFQLKIYGCSPVQFISRHSLWIYLWHIMFICCFNYVIVISNWVIQYVLILVGSIAVTAIQNGIVRFLQDKTNWNIWVVFKG